VSSIDEFYNVDIREFDPEIPADDWSLDIFGQISGTEITITFDDLTEMPIEHRYMTIRCVGDRLNGEQMDTAVWTGTPIKPFIDEVDPNGDCGCATLRAEDGYYVQFPVDALEDGFLAWRMNGRPLPKAHGFPVRVLIPGRWGETNVKWLNEIELLEKETEGYWEKRGWEGTGPVHTVAKLHVINDLDDGRKRLGGHAYAGTRGIRKVEVSTDAGRTWNKATLSEPLEGDDVWRQWEYRYEPPDETHIAVVRAIDGNGDVQSRGDSSESANTFSTSGATGWVTQTID
jgi:DMSO/TMAO reductase YedYZ molybdopterin-dependent catalytic subunit